MTHAIRMRLFTGFSYRDVADYGYQDHPLFFQSWVSLVPVMVSVGPFRRCECGRWSRCLRLHKVHWVDCHFDEERS